MKTTSMKKSLAQRCALSAGMLIAVVGCGGAQNSETTTAAAPQANPIHDVSTWPVRSFSDFGLSLRLPDLPLRDFAVEPAPATGGAECSRGEVSFLPAMNRKFDNGLRCSAVLPNSGGAILMQAADVPMSVAFGQPFKDTCKAMGRMGLFDESGCDVEPVNGAIRFGFRPGDLHQQEDQGHVAGEFRLVGNRVVTMMIGVQDPGPNFPAFANAVFDAITLDNPLPTASLPTTWAPLAEIGSRVQVNVPEGTTLDTTVGLPMFDRTWAFDSATARVRFQVRAFLSPFGMGLDPADAAGYRAKHQAQCAADAASLQSCSVTDDEGGWPFVEWSREIAPGVFFRERAVYAHGSGWSAGVLGSSEVVHSAEANAFLASLKLVERPAAPPATAPARNRGRARRAH